ncbi:MAG: aldolase [Dehalococcoidia bacterium]|nr:aldolase [Dehalococcoidia bacterium]
MIDEQVLRSFQEIGRDLYVAGLVSSHGGNLSVRFGDRIIIKRRGAMLGRLTEEDLVETRLAKPDSGVMLASTELVVHRAIYLATPALAVVHAHPRAAIALSLSREEIVPIDNEGSYLLHKVPVVAAEFASGSAEMVEKLPAALRQYKIVMLRGHGCFSIGQTLDEAFQWVSCLEESCEIILAAKLIDEPFLEYRKMSEEYRSW